MPSGRRFPLPTWDHTSFGMSHGRDYRKKKEPGNGT
jgi:hypothetical protein